jgi:hypothetical protein
LVTLPCAYTRQRHHVAHTCASGWPDGLPGRVFAVRAGARQRQGGRTAKGMAQQRARHTAEKTRTAARTTHGREFAHGNGGDARQRRRARQRAGTHGNVLPARQSSLPSHLRETHGNVFVAEHDFAVPALPCVDARQCRCRAI